MSELSEQAVTLADRHDPDQMRAMVRRLDQIREDLCRLVRSTPLDALTRRPGDDKWSALEHLRHLLFAEDLYVNRWILRNDTAFSGLGNLPDFLRGRPGFETAGADPTTDVEKIIHEWAAIHKLTLAFVTDATADQLTTDTSDIDFGQGTVGGVLQGMARHDLHHIRCIEQAIAAEEAE